MNQRSSPRPSRCWTPSSVTRFPQGALTRSARMPCSGADRLGDRGASGTKKGSPGGSLGQYAFCSSGPVGRFEAL